MVQSRALPIVESWKERARELRLDAHVVYSASKDPRMPWYVKLIAALVVGYLFSPIDLIPDFIPVLGYMDDLVIVPLGLLLVVKLIPEDVLAEHREAARARKDVPKKWRAAAAIVTVWTLLATLVLFYVLTRSLKVR